MAASRNWGSFEEEFAAPQLHWKGFEVIQGRFRADPNYVAVSVYWESFLLVPS